MAIEIRKLSKHDDRTGFCCGDAQLDHFFQVFAGQNQFKHHVGVTYIAVEDEVLLGFVTVSIGSLEHEDLPNAHRKRLPRYPLPILRLARLGVSIDAQGRGIGARLLREMFIIAQDLKTKVGCVAVIVDAKADAVGLYERYGFTPLIELVEGRMATYPANTPMFLPVDEIPHPTGKQRDR